MMSDKIKCRVPHVRLLLANVGSSALQLSDDFAFAFGATE